MTIQFASPVDIDYSAALQNIRKPLTPFERDFLAALCLAPEGGIKASELASLLGKSHHLIINKVIGQVGRKIADAANFEPEKRRGGSTRWWSIVATGEKHGKDFFWTIRPKLEEALQLEASFNSETAPKSVQGGDSVLYEGSEVYRKSRRYERNPLARQQCIDHYGAICAACGLDFELRYGSVAKGLIQVHHLKPLAALGGQRIVVDPIQDLRPVCANCHLVIHRREPPYTIEDVQDFLSAR